MIIISNIGSLCWSSQSQDHSKSLVGVPNALALGLPQASEEGNLTRTEDDHDDGDEDVDDFDAREIVKAHKGWIKMTLSVPENI